MKTYLYVYGIPDHSSFNEFIIKEFQMMGMIPDPPNYIPQTGELHQFWLSAIDALSAHIAILDDLGNILFVNASWRQFGQKQQTNL